MRRLLAKHRTEMVYAGHASQSINELRLLPRSHARQTVELAHIVVTPPATVYRHIDVFGNEVAWFQLDEAHDRLIVESHALVNVAGSGLTDDAIPRQRLDDPHLVDQFAEFLLPSPLVEWGDGVRTLAAAAGPLDDAAVDVWLRAAERMVNECIVYRQGVTGVDTAVEEVVRAGHGVCQDMAHLFIAICRNRGVPARYISGWMHAPGRDEPSESHAWCEAWVPGRGWCEFDPTHPDPDLSQYIRVAVGRDYTDVPPFRGTYVGDPTAEMIVTVEIDERPSDEGAVGVLPAARRATGVGRGGGEQTLGQAVSGGRSPGR
jgi:transglutaminase-like putative cysteine protease